jgi:hypothetical protein
MTNRDARHHERVLIYPPVAAIDVAYQREGAVPRPCQWRRDAVDRVLDQVKKPALERRRHHPTSS